MIAMKNIGEIFRCIIKKQMIFCDAFLLKECSIGACEVIKR
jgi:hypothetical protein